VLHRNAAHALSRQLRAGRAKILTPLGDESLGIQLQVTSVAPQKSLGINLSRHPGPFAGFQGGQVFSTNA
jgi:hypothetical protein